MRWRLIGPTPIEMVGVGRPKLQSSLLVVLWLTWSAMIFQASWANPLIINHSIVMAKGEKVCGPRLVELLTRTCVTFPEPFQANVRTENDSQHGIVQECCERSCDAKTLAQYCNEVKIWTDLQSAPASTPLTPLPATEEPLPASPNGIIDITMVDLEFLPLHLIPVRSSPDLIGHSLDH